MNFAELLKNPNATVAPTIEAFANVENTGVSAIEGIDFDELLRSKEYSIHGLNLDREEIVSRLEDPALVEHVKNARVAYASVLNEKEKQELDDLLKKTRVRFDGTRRYASTYYTLLSELGDKYLVIHDRILATRTSYPAEISEAKAFVETYGEAAVAKSKHACDNANITVEEMRKITSMTYLILERALLVARAKNKATEQLSLQLDDLGEAILEVKQGARNLSQEYEQCVDPLLDMFEARENQPRFIAG